MKIPQGNTINGIPCHRIHGWREPQVQRKLVYQPSIWLWSVALMTGSSQTLKKKKKEFLLKLITPLKFNTGHPSLP